MGNLARVCIIIVAGWLALIYGGSDLWLGSVASITAGCIWLIGRELRAEISNPAGLAAFTGLAAIGLSSNLSAWAMLLAVTGALITWDLDLFATRLARSARIENRERLVRAHLGRLTFIATLSLMLGGLGLGIELRLNLVAALGLGSIAVLLLARMLRSG
jgi:hypothetical protein